ncbi:hypothetical protein [Methylococcus capsulatus]|uniref:hypothetical protein n=1 Tax=Methylococcus capsulatus TaxID=414 RepID=UPI0020181082|nr:hypothetical protein [Methylococcus capsulatus]UQN11054.1 hypothetical protein M3M30_08375 [Methylococcus capsulatus]
MVRVSLRFRPFYSKGTKVEAKSAPSAASGLEGTSSVIAGIGLKCAFLGSVCSNAVARVSASDRQDLVDWPGLKRREKIGEKMRLADRPGSAVLKLGVAMTDAENATIWRRTPSPSSSALTLKPRSPIP